jgi:hypothetical protein
VLAGCNKSILINIETYVRGSCSVVLWGNQKGRKRKEKEEKKDDKCW